MTKILATGMTPVGFMDVKITGDRVVTSIECRPSDYEKYIRREIEKGSGWIANAYYPKPGTMLQALAYCQNIFGIDNVTVEGNIKPISAEKGIVY